MVETAENVDAAAATPRSARGTPIWRRLNYRNLPAGAFSLAIGGLIIGLASPGLFAGLALLPADDVPVRLHRGEAVTTAALGTGALRRKNALAMEGNARTWTELGVIYFERARRLGTSHKGYAVYLDRAIDALRRGLARAPAQPRAWVLLARAVSARNGANGALGPVLRAAIRAAPRDPRLLLARVDLALAAWDRLDAETRRLVAMQVSLGVDTMPAALVRLAGRRGAVERVREILANDPTRRRRFDAAAAPRDADSGNR